MRLTLRTLLAYRDGVLSPADAEEMHRRIQQSEDASKLLKRIESIAPQIQSASARIVDKGLGGDPNSLAEYLDDVLQSKQVPELERVCLESNEYLAELASCHSLLATALNTRVRVPNSLRELARQVDSEEGREAIRAQLAERKQSRNHSSKSSSVHADLVRHDKAHVQGVAPEGSSGSDADALKDADAVKNNATDAHYSSEESVQVQAPMLASGGESIRQQGLSLEGAKLAHEVPEYLQGKKGGNWAIPAGIVGLFLLFAFLVWQSLGPLDRVRELFVANPQANPEPAEEENGVVHQGAVASNLDADEKTPSVDVDGKSQAANTSTEQSAGASSSQLASESDTAPDRVDSASGNFETRPLSEGSEDSSGSGSVSVDAESNPGGTTPSSSSNSATQPADSGASEAGSASGSPAGNDQVANPDTAIMLESLTWSPSPDEADAVLLAKAGNGAWERLGPGVQVPDGSHVVVPPHSIVRLQASSSPEWRLSGPSVGRFLDKQSVELKLGRALVSAMEPKQELKVAAPVAGEVRVSLATSDTVVAIEQTYRRQRYGPVTDAANFPSVLIIAIVDGSAIVTSADGKEHAVGLGEGLAWVGDGNAQKFRMQSIPDWYRMRPLRPIDMEAAKVFSADLIVDPGNPAQKLEGVLRSLTNHWRPEEVALAVQTSMLLGKFDSIVEHGFFNDDRMSIHWFDTLALARRLLAADPSQAAALQQHLQNAFADGDVAFEALLGVPETKLTQEGLAALIDLLESKEMAARVIGFDQLQLITGRKLGYRPSVPVASSVLNWRRELAKKRVQPLPLREPIWERLRGAP